MQDYTQEYLQSLDKQHGEDLESYKDDYRGMIIGSIAAIAKHSQAILDNLNDPKVRENLTEPFLQSTAALAEDYMQTIHNFVMFNPQRKD